MGILVLIYISGFCFFWFSEGIIGGTLIAVMSTLISPSLGAAFHQSAFKTGTYRSGGGMTTLLLMLALCFWTYQSGFELRLVDTSIPGLAWVWLGAALGYNMSNQRYGGHED